MSFVLETSTLINQPTRQAPRGRYPRSTYKRSAAVPIKKRRTMSAAARKRMAESMRNVGLPQRSQQEAAVGTKIGPKWVLAPTGWLRLACSYFLSPGVSMIPAQ